MSVVLWIWFITFISLLINLSLAWHPHKSPFSLNLLVSYFTHTHIQSVLLSYALQHLPGPEPPSAVRLAHCTRVWVMCGGGFSGASCLIKTSCQPFRFSSPESLLGFPERSWMFLGLLVRDCCDTGTGDETDLPLHTNTALHSRPCVQLVGMTQEAQGFIESCWGCCASQAGALAKLSLQGSRSERADGTQAAWPIVTVSVGRGGACERGEMRPGLRSALV